MKAPVLRVIDPGMSATFQDQGRHGWRRFGAPPGGAMDLHAATMANRLLDNPPWAPVVEVLWQGARFEALAESWLVLAGADMMANRERWRALRLRPGETLTLPHNQNGVWAYVAVEGGFVAPLWLDSASPLGTASGGERLLRGDILHRDGSSGFDLPPGVAGRFAAPSEQRDYEHPPQLRVFQGPQWAQFSAEARERLFTQQWAVCSQSNRVGYRLEASPLPVPKIEMVSEPLLVGSLQVPENGQLLAILRDGPTIGGYPTIGLVHSDDINWLVQCRPSQTVQFSLMPQ
jgi:5-oxoprolinase (ATP-hydrolysing) subunit C